MSAPVLDIRALTAGYNGVPAVRDLQVAVGAGEVVALLGANGAGKTTTLRTVSGLIRPIAGTVRFAGRDLAGVSPGARARLGIAHVPEGRGLFFGLTVAPLRDQRAGLLSGGEQQMLAVGRALARRPSLLLLDELSLGLAPVIVEKLLPVIRGYATETDCAVLLVEQHVGLALEAADRGYVLSHGTVTAHQPAARLRADQSLILAGYLGEANATGRTGETQERVT
jgi:ABC-type branched-subunit amino acid transport system ATPase component